MEVQGQRAGSRVSGFAETMRLFILVGPVGIGRRRTDTHREVNPHAQVRSSGNIRPSAFSYLMNRDEAAILYEMSTNDVNED